MISTIAAALLLSQSSALPAEVPFKMAETALIVEAVVNGKKASFMFDTGFSGNVLLNDSVYVGPSKGSMTLRDFVGEFTAKTVPLKSLKLGALTISPVGKEIVQQPLEHLSIGYNTHTDGILGYDAVKDYITEINFEKSKLIFHPNSLDITKRKPDNKRTFLAKLLPIGNGSLEMEVIANKSGKKLILALDTGNSFYATTHKDVLERVGLWQPDRKPQYMRSSWVGSGPVDSWSKYMEDLTIFGVPVKTSVWDIIDVPASSAEGDGTVGFGFLKNFNIIIDYERRRVWLENFTGKVNNDPEGDIGVSAGYDPGSKRVRVYGVTPNSPAEKAGVKRGDVVLSVDGTDVFNSTFREMDFLFQGEKGKKVELAVSRDGNLIRYSIERDYLVNDFKPPK